MKKLLSLCLALALLLSLLPAAALAEGESAADEEALLITLAEPEPEAEDGLIPLIEPLDAQAQGEDEGIDVTQYSYEVTPVLVPFPYALYVKTDNPDPSSFRLVDRDSRYYEDGDYSAIRFMGDDGYARLRTLDPGTYYLSPETMIDVRYEDAETARVAGGYVFISRYAYGDGGEFVLQQRLPGGDSIINYSYEDTQLRVPCQALKMHYDYLIDTYTSEEQSFFDKLDAVQLALYKLAVYPRYVYDSNRPNEERPYPFLATSPYPELDLNEHYNYMFAELEDDRMLLMYAYPFILDSLGFPGLIGRVARILDPDCEVTRGEYHYLVDITHDGETRSYGGAGAGGNDPLFSNRVTPLYAFDGSGTLDGADLEASCAQLLSYEAVAAEDIAAYRDLIHGDTFRRTIAATGGTVIRAGTEGFGIGTSFCYLVPLAGSVRILSKAWVGGWYINEKESLMLGESFADHPTASVVVPKMSYTDRYGEEHVQDVIFQYDKNSDTWRAPEFYENKTYYYAGTELPAEFILSREQVEALIDTESGKHLPTSGLVYDGTEYPGTPYTLVNVTGLEVTPEATLRVDDNILIDATILPEDAFANSIRWTSSDPEVVEVSMNYDRPGAWLYGKSVGTATVTGTTADGLYSASCRVTVLKKHIEGDLNDDDVADLTDAELLFRYVTGLIDEIDAPEEFMDLNGDGVINNLDVRCLYRLANGLRLYHYDIPRTSVINFEVDRVSAQAGEADVHVGVMIPRNNGGFVTMRLNVEYDRSALRFNTASDFGEVFRNAEGAYMLTTWSEGVSEGRPLTANWINTDYSCHDQNIFLDLVFDVLPGAACGEYAVTVSCAEEDCFDYYDNPVMVTVVPGGITVEHSWGEPEYTWTETETGYSVTAKVTCLSDPSHVVTETEEAGIVYQIDPDCESEGFARYAVWFRNPLFENQVYETVLPAKGHTPGEPIREDETAPTCTEDGGYYEVISCTVCYRMLSMEYVVVPATGHDWAEPGYTWAADNSEVTARRVCRTDENHRESETAATVSEVTKPAGCEEPGERTYTAVFQNEAFATQTKTEPIPAAGHSYGEPAWTWAEDHSSAAAAFTCERCGDTQSVNAAVTSERTEPTTEEDGKIVYTAAVEFEGRTYTDTKTELLPKLPVETIEGPALSLGGTSTQGIAQSWTPVQGASGYLLEIRSKEGVGNIGVEGTEYLYADAQMGESYSFRVEALLEGANSDWNNELSVFYNPFADVAGKKIIEYVAWAFNNGIVNGTSTTTFTPDEPCTRVQFLMMLWKMHGSPIVERENPFSDVSGRKTTNAVLWALDAGVIIEAEKFNPNDNISRVQIVMILWKLAGSPEVTGENPFADVSGKKTTKAVLWAYENGITKGTSTTTFAPDADCTRVQLVVFLYKYNGIYPVI